MEVEVEVEGEGRRKGSNSESEEEVHTVVPNTKNAICDSLSTKILTKLYFSSLFFLLYIFMITENTT